VSETGWPPGHAFISYVHEDWPSADRLQRILQGAGIRVWRDTADLWPGEDWRLKIRRAITDDALVFLACFSRNSLARQKSYQNEELALAVSQIRLRAPGEPWLIPVRFDDCTIPDIDIGGGRSLGSIQRADLLGHQFDDGAARLAVAIQRILRHQARDSGSMDSPDCGRIPEARDWGRPMSEDKQTFNFNNYAGSSVEEQIGHIDTFNRYATINEPAESGKADVSEEGRDGKPD
jgi:TIR domain-containing protein